MKYADRRPRFSKSNMSNLIFYYSLFYIIAKLNAAFLQKKNIHGKNDFAEIFKNLVRYRSENNFIEKSSIMSDAVK